MKLKKLDRYWLFFFAHACFFVALMIVANGLWGIGLSYMLGLTLSFEKFEREYDL